MTSGLPAQMSFSCSGIGFSPSGSYCWSSLVAIAASSYPFGTGTGTVLSDTHTLLSSSHPCPCVFSVLSTHASACFGSS